MSDELKSAYELAMERLRAKSPTVETPLTDAQKQQIAAVREEAQVRRTEARVLHEQALRAAREKGDRDKLARLVADYERECAKLDEDEARQVAAIRG